MILSTSSVRQFSDQYRAIPLLHYNIPRTHFRLFSFTPLILKNSLILQRVSSEKRTQEVEIRTLLLRRSISNSAASCQKASNIPDHEKIHYTRHCFSMIGIGYRMKNFLILYSGIRPIGSASVQPARKFSELGACDTKGTAHLISYRIASITGFWNGTFPIRHRYVRLDTRDFMHSRYRGLE